MQLLSEDLSPEVSSRRSKSDPALTPRQYPRVGTPYPKPQQKQTLPPSKIPRLTTQNNQPLDFIRNSGHKQLRPKLPQKQELFPSPNQSSTTTLHYPREILYSASPQGSFTDLYKYCQPPISPPLVQVYRKNSNFRKPAFSTNFTKYGQQQQQALLKQQCHHQQHQRSYSPDYHLLTCKDFEKPKHPTNVDILNSNPSTTNILNKAKFVRNLGAILDSEGYLQGPHTSHNKRIIEFDKKPNLGSEKALTRIFSAEQDRGDYNHCNYNFSNKTNGPSNNGLPPLPPNLRSKLEQDYLYSPRIATATLSQGNTVFETHNGAPFTNHIQSLSPRSASRSVPSTPTNRRGNIRTNIDLFNSPRKSNFSTTSLQSKVHEAESCTNLLLHKKYSEPQFSTNKCPLCAESKGQCHLHHRTMCSRYMTDLEWRICHAVNIYVYKNGEEGQTPVLVHIPPSKKKNMKSVMTVIQERICYPIGYAKYLYRMNGKKVSNPCELEMYNNYVVASNYDKCYKCVCYARRKSPLLVLAKESKHVRELRHKNYQYELFLSKKRCCDGERQCATINESGYPDGYIPGQMPIGPPMAQIPVTLRCCGGPNCNIKNCSCKKKPKYMTESMPGEEQSQNNSGISNNSFEYMTNSCTISTAPLKDPSDFLKKKDKESDEPSTRYRALMNDDESLFYSSKKKKLSRGVLDTSGEGKKIFYQESDFINANPHGMEGSYEMEGVGAHKNTYDSQPMTNEISTTQENADKECKLNHITNGRLDQVPPHFSSNQNNGNIDSIEETLAKTQNIFNIGNARRSTAKEGKGDEPRQLQQETTAQYHHQLENLTRFEEVGQFDDHQMNKEVQRLSNTEAYDPLEVPSTHIMDDNYSFRQPTPMPASMTPSQNMDACANTLISVPSKSYTVLTQHLSDKGHNKHTQVTSYVSPPRVPTPFPKKETRDSRQRVIVQDLNCNTTNVSSGSNQNTKPPIPNSNIGPRYTMNGASPIYLAGNQPTYPCYGPTVPQSTNSFFVQSTTAPHTKMQPHSQPHIQQMYPVEILNQRPSYGPMMVENPNLGCFGYGNGDSSLSFASNCYFTDEIDIPYTRPVAYQHPHSGRTVDQVGVGNYMQVPSYVNINRNITPNLSQQFSYRGDLQGYTSPNRSMGLVAITKPSRRNVAIQMGEPSSSSLESRSPPQVMNTMDPHQSMSPLAGSPREPQRNVYTPSPYYYTGGAEVGNPSYQYQQQQPLPMQMTDPSVLPPPTRYRDGSLENRQFRPCSKPSHNFARAGGAGNRRDESLCKENIEFYGLVHEAKHPRYVWKKS